MSTLKLAQEPSQFVPVAGVCVSPAYTFGMALPADCSNACFGAGLVGIGLCHLFAASGCEDSNFASEMDELANHMGLFLQKTNIIRDYLEDICELPAPRMFWPQEIWGQYAEQLDAFRDPANRCGARFCAGCVGAVDALLHVSAALHKLVGNNATRPSFLPALYCMLWLLAGLC